MFDAKSLLENLVRNAAPQAPAQSAQGGGLGDILGQVLKGGGSGQGGGLDILKELEKMARGPASNAVEDEGAPDPRNSAPAGLPGGLGDILGQLKDKMGQATGGLQGGGIADILGQVLAQATSGVKEGAGKLDSATGATEALGKALGKSPQDILAQLQEIVKNNPLAAGTAMGGLGGLVLGTRTGRSIAGSAAKVGAWALIGGLAYKAFQNYQAGRPLVTGASTPEVAPQGSGFEPAAITNEAATLYIKAMVAAAAADGRLDNAEQMKITGSLKQAGLDAEAEEFLATVFNAPPSPDELAEEVSSPEEGIQVYTAARVAIEPDTTAEKNFLKTLAAALGIDDKLAAHIDATARSAAA